VFRMGLFAMSPFSFRISCTNITYTHIHYDIHTHMTCIHFFLLMGFFFLSTLYISTPVHDLCACVVFMINKLWRHTRGIYM